VDYLQFKREFDEAHTALALPADCSQPLDPVFNPITQYSWMFTWHLMFADNKYIRIWEDHCRVKGLQESRRARMAYHYGPTPKIGKDGVPKYDSAGPVDIRIDNSQQKIHLHLGTPNPHIYQENVEKLDLAKLDMFTFMDAIFKHRSNGKPLGKVLGFKII
jgi:hypothetical protein